MPGMNCCIVGFERRSLGDHGVREMKFIHTVSGALLLGFFCAVSPAAAGHGGDRAAREDGFISGTQARVSEVIEDLARRIDSIVGGERALDERTGTYILFRGFFSERYGSDPEVGVLTRAQLMLPITERKLRFQIDTRSVPDLAANDAKQARSPSAEDAGPGSPRTETLRAGIIADLLRGDGVAASLGAGVKVSPSPDLFLKGHVEHARALGGGFAMKAGETAYWYVDDGPESRTMMSIEKALDGDTVVRSTSAALWTGKDRQWALAEFLSLSHSVDPHTGVVFRAGETWSYKGGFKREEYLVDAGLRRRLYGNWFFFEWRSGVSWPRDRGFSPTPVSTIWLDVFFGERK